MDYAQDLVFDPHHMNDEGLATQQSREAPGAYDHTLQHPPPKQIIPAKPIDVVDNSRSAKNTYFSTINVNSSTASKIVSANPGRQWIMLWTPAGESVYIAHSPDNLDLATPLGALLLPSLIYTFFSKDAIYGIAVANPTLVYVAVGEN